MTAAERLEKLEAGLHAYVAELRAYAWQQSELDPFHRGIKASTLDIAGEIERRFLREPEKEDP